MLLGNDLLWNGNNILTTESLKRIVLFFSDNECFSKQLKYNCVCSFVQLCLTLWDPMDYSLSGFLSQEFSSEEYWSDSIPRFLRNFHTVLHSGCTSLHSHQQCKRVSFFSTPSPAIVVCRLFYGGHSDWQRRYLIVFLICISLIMSDTVIWESYKSFHVFYEPSVYRLWRNVCLVFGPLFDWVVHFSGIELHELLIYFGA